jgi:predicted Zn-dependent protease
MIPVEKEIALGRASLKQIEQLLGYGEDKSLTCTGVKGQLALDKMTARLTAHFDSPYPLDIKVFNDEMPNAFAVPGGHIVLFDGLLKMADSPEEVAAVLGHEIGHVINRDPTRLTLRSAGSVGILGMVFGDFAGGAVALIVAERLIAADYSREAEADADSFAHNLLQDAKLPSAPMARFFEKLKDKYGDGPKLLSHIASHPDLQGRADAANNADVIGEGSFDAVLSASEWKDLQGMCAEGS